MESHEYKWSEHLKTNSETAVNLPLCLLKHDAMKTCGGVAV